MKKFKRLFIALLCAALLLPVGVSAAEVYDYYPVPEHRDIVINGCSEEQDWEESLLIKMDTDVAHGKNAIVRVMCDRSYLYLQFYVNDDDRAEYYGMPDGVSFELVEGARSRSFFGAYDGRKLQAESDGFAYAAVNDDFYYVLEFRVAFAKPWKSDGTFSLNVCVNDNVVSGSQVKKNVFKKSMQIRLFLKDPYAQQTTTVKATTTKPPATTKSSETKPPKTTAAVTTKRSSEKTSAKTADSEEATDGTAFADAFEDDALRESGASEAGNDSADALNEAASSSSSSGEAFEVEESFTPGGDNARATQALGTLLSAVLLISGVCAIVRLRRAKNAENSGDENE